MDGAGVLWFWHRFWLELILSPSHPVKSYPAWRMRQANSTTRIPAANFHAPSKTAFHENGTVGEESNGRTGSGLRAPEVPRDSLTAPPQRSTH